MTGCEYDEMDPDTSTIHLCRTSQLPWEKACYVHEKILIVLVKFLEMNM